MNLGMGALTAGITTSILGGMGNDDMAGKFGNASAKGLGMVATAGYGMAALDMLKPKKKQKW